MAGNIWIKRIFLYFFISFLIILLNSLYITYFVTHDTNIDNARYMLSALIQSEAAIMAIVITLTLVAIQQASSSYSTRVLDIFKGRNPDFWIIFFIYLTAIIFGLNVLINLKDSHIPPIEEQIRLAYYLGILAFFSLIPYMWNTIDLLKPTRIIKFFSENVNKENVISAIQDEKEFNGEDPLLPIIDIIISSLMKCDYDTSRGGLNEIISITADILNKTHSKEEYELILKYLINHFEIIGKIAIEKKDENSIRIILDWYYSITKITIVKQMDFESCFLLHSIGNIGVLLVEQKMIKSSIFTIRTIESISRIPAINMKYFSRCTIIALTEITEKIAEQKLKDFMDEIVFILYDFVKEGFEKEEELPKDQIENEQDEFLDELFSMLEDTPSDTVILVLRPILRTGKILIEKKMDEDLRKIMVFIEVVRKMAIKYKRNDVILLINKFYKETQSTEIYTRE